MILHAAFVQQHVADEQVALENRPLVVRKCGCRDRETGIAAGDSASSSASVTGPMFPFASCRTSSST
jgi:hypothetical protein